MRSPDTAPFASALAGLLLAFSSSAVAQDSVSVSIGAGPSGLSMNINTDDPSAGGTQVVMTQIGGYGEAVVVDRRALLTTLGDLTEELARLQGMTAGGDKRACRRAAQDLRTLRRSVKQLQDDLRHAPRVDLGQVAPPPPPAPLPPPPAPVGPIALEGPRFSEIVSAIEAESFAAGKLAVLRDATDYAWYTTGQVVRIIGLFDFGSGKLKALQIMAPQIVNPGKAFKIYGAFDFDGDKKKARKILRAARR